MSKTSILVSLALGGFVLAGCNKDETTPPPTTPSTVPSIPTTTPSMMPHLPATTMPDLTIPSVTVPTTVPATLPSLGDLGGKLKDEVKAATQSTTPVVPDTK